VVEAEKVMRDAVVDLIMLEVALPGLNGLEFCRNLRSRSIRTPVLIVSRRTQEVDIVMGLEAGADDYIVKPFSSQEMLARVRAALRRAGYGLPDLVSAGPLTVDLKQQRVTRNGIPVRLSGKETALLCYLASRPNQIVSREELLMKVWGYEAADSRTVDNFVARLRGKIEDNPKLPTILITVYGEGYKLAF
jgi:two-component system response regulator MtrA